MKICVGTRYQTNVENFSGKNRFGLKECVLSITSHKFGKIYGGGLKDGGIYPCI